MPKELDIYSNGFYVDISSISSRDTKRIIQEFKYYQLRGSRLVRLLESRDRLQEIESELENAKLEIKALKEAVQAREDLYAAAQLVIETTDDLREENDDGNNECSKS